MKYSNIKNVCVLDSMYTLLQYLLLQKRGDIDNTFFFWSDGISTNVREFFKNQSKYIPIQNNKIDTNTEKLHYYRRICFYAKLFYVHILFLIKWPFLRLNSINYYGVDHLQFSINILRNHTFSLLEDGTLNYFTCNLFSQISTKQQKIFKIIYGKDFSKKKIYAGDEPKCKCIHLTGLLPLPSDYPRNVLIDSLQSLWSKSDENKREYINRVYGLSEMSLEKLQKCNRILMTRPFSEDNWMTEDEKIGIYKKIINIVGPHGLLIKTHPREKTDYSIYFPNITIMNQSIPIQLLTFNGIKFEEAYAIATTSIFDFPYHIKVGYIGSEIDCRIEKRMPNMRTDNISFEGKDIELLNVVI